MLNSYGGTYIETPNLNRLAKKSIQFNSDEDLRIEIEEKIKKFNANNELDLL